MKRTIATLTAVVVAGSLVAACSRADADTADTTIAATTTEPAATTTASTTTTSTSTTTTSTSTTTSTTTIPPTTTTTLPPIDRMPLTGTPIDDLALIPDRPALVVKMPNNRQALPQTGLNEADIVFEEIINDNLTRFASVFHSQGSTPVGPIRSGRFQDIDMLLAFNRPLFAWSGGNDSVEAAIDASNLIDIGPGKGNGYYRRSGRGGAPHNFFADSTEALWANTPPEYEVPDVVFPYLRPEEPVTGDPATTINVTLDSIDAEWRYDAESGRYYRWQEGSPHPTELTGQVWADNVVVFVADYTPNPADGTPNAATIGNNPVYIFTGGTVREGIWLRFAQTDPYAFYDNLDDGNELGLQAGRTWVEIPRNVDGVVTWS